MTGLAITLKGACVFRGEGSSDATRVLGPVDVGIHAGEHVALVGPNGAGKTSLLLALVGAAASEGTIEVGPHRLSPSSLAAVRARVSLVFAEPADQLFTDSVSEEVAFGPRQDGVDAEDVARRTQDALRAVGLEGLESRRPHALSLGQQRRLAIATALSRDAGVVLCDEPTAGLDPVARRNVLGILRGLSETLVLATHDLDAARRCAERVILLRDGEIVAQGPMGLLDDVGVLERAGLA
jgi:cobalt/nickel transport system ATP-binding protein